MASLNKVQVIGNVTRDIELKRTPGGNAVCDVGVAINEKRKDASGQWVEEVLFLDVTLWGRTAEVAAEYAGKGAPVYLEGRMKMDSWTDQSGQERKKLKVIGDRLQLLGGKLDSTPAPKQAPKPEPSADEFPF